MPSSDPLSSSQPALGASRDRQSSHPVQDEATKDQKAPDDQKHQVHVQEVERSPPLQEPAPKRKLSGDIQASQSARRQRLEPGRSPSPGTEQDPLNQEKIDPVDHWVRYNSWPSNYTESAVPAEALTGVRRTSSKRDSKSASNKLNWDWDMGFSPPEQETASSSGTRRNLLNDSKTLDFFRKHPKTLDFFDKNSKERPEGLTESAKETCRKVLESKDIECNETGPWMFYNDKWFERVSKRLKEMNESKVIQDVKPLVVPPVEPFYYGGDDSLKYLTESVDETWSLCIPILPGDVPKPDYAAGYSLDVAFTKEQQQVLRQFYTPAGDCPMRVTHRMVFPFLSCEAASGASDAPSLYEAEKQNTESTLIAMRGVTELFERANRASEIQLEILAFSVVYDDHEVRLFAHYADVYVDSPQPDFYRQKIYQSFFPDVGLAAFRMIKYIYKVWAREHWERICSAIDTISKMPAYTSSTASSSSVTGTRTPAPGSMPEDQKHQVHIQEVECSSSLQEPARKRKRSPSPFPLDGDTAPNAEIPPSPTGQKSSLVPDSEGPNQENGGISDPVDFWRKQHAWPSTYFESDASAQMNVRRSPSLKSVRSHNNKKIWDLDISDSGSDSPETRKRHMENGTVTTYLMLHSQEYPQGLPETAETLLQRLRTEEQTVPAMWDDAAVLSKVGKRTKNRGEAKVVVDVGHFVLPRVDHLYYFDDSFEYLAESFDESWSQCVPLLGSTCPKPDYAAGFHWNAAFSDRQIEVLQTLGPDRSCTFFRTTLELYFPFLTAKAKSGTESLAAEAEKQNVETTLIAMRGVIELFRQAKQDDKIHMQILAFSVVYDDTIVSIYAHFADVRPYYPKFYRHSVGDFRFPTDVWASHKFIKNIYKLWVPFHHKRICDAIEVLAKNGGGSYASSGASSAAGRNPKSSSASATDGAPRSGPMNPPAPPPPAASASGHGRHLPPNTSPTRDVKKPKTSG